MDSYSGKTYAMRPHHSQHLSAGRAASHQSAGEQSSAAQRYSPMEALSPTTPYNASPSTNQNPYAAARQSPTRSGTYSSPNSYYSNRAQAQQLPPITPYASSNEGYPQSATAQLNAVFGNNDPKSPRVRGPPQQAPAGGKGPVPQFQKVRSVSDLQPKINAQPAFRRANPEGGFISVSALADCLGFLELIFLSCSHSKRSRLICPRRTESAIRASSTSRVATQGESLRSRARASRTMGLIMRIVITFYMSMIFLVLRKPGTSTFLAVEMRGCRLITIGIDTLSSTFWAKGRLGRSLSVRI